MKPYLVAKDGKVDSAAAMKRVIEVGHELEKQAMLLKKSVGRHKRASEALKVMVIKLEGKDEQD